MSCAFWVPWCFFDPRCASRVFWHHPYTWFYGSGLRTSNCLCASLAAGSRKGSHCLACVFLGRSTVWARFWDATTSCQCPRMFWFSFDIHLLFVHMYHYFLAEEVGFYTFLVEEYSSIFASKWSMVATACSQAEEWRRSVAHDHKYADLADTSLVTRVSCISLSDTSDWVKGWRGWKKVTLPETNSSPMKIPIFPGKYHPKWWIFQPAMLVFREGRYSADAVYCIGFYGCFQE